MTTIIGMIASMVLVLSGGLIASGWTVLGFLCAGIGAMTLGTVTAMARLAGFQHFVDTTGEGTTVGELCDIFYANNDGSYDGLAICTPIFVQTDGAPARANGTYTARYNGQDVLVIEAATRED